MLRSICEELTVALVNNKVIKSENRDFYIYGLEMFFFQAAFCGLVIISALFTHTVIESLIFLVAFSTLRQQTGGYHCDSMGMCLLVSFFIYLIMILLNFFVLDGIGTSEIAVSAISMIIIFIFSPLSSENKPFTKDENIKCRKMSLLLTGLYFVIYSVSCYFNLYAVAIALFRHWRQ
jgi:accessory gene regulator B